MKKQADTGKSRVHTNEEKRERKRIFLKAYDVEWELRHKYIIPGRMTVLCASEKGLRPKGALIGVRLNLKSKSGGPEIQRTVVLDAKGVARVSGLGQHLEEPPDEEEYVI